MKYENDCFIDKIDIMLNIIADADSNDKSRLVIEYGSLVLKCDQEELVLEKYIDGYTETLKFLVNYLLHELYPKKEELAKKWLAIYLEGTIDALVKCIIYTVIICVKSMNLPYIKYVRYDYI